MKIQRVKVLWILLAVFAKGEDLVIRNITTNEVVDRAVVIKEPWNADLLEKRFRDFYSLERGKHKLFRLTVGTNPNSVKRALHHGNDVATFDRTIQEIKGGLDQSLPIAQIWGIGDSAVMCFRTHEGFTSTQIGPLDTTHVTAHSGNKFRILHFNLTGVVPHSKNYQLRVFLKSVNVLSLADSVAVLNDLRHRIGVTVFTVEIRPDEWFLESPDFPLLFPFTKSWTVPNEADFRLPGYITCGYQSKQGIKCSGSGFRP